MLQFANFIKGSFLKKIVAAIMVSLLTLNLSVNTAFNGGKTELDPGDYKNVILLIGDGMGFYHVDWMEKEYGIETANMFAMTETHGMSQTRSSSAAVTDSAAGGTALACATRTTNGAIGVFPQDQFGVAYVAMNLCELAKSYGKMAGVVTSDYNSGATPSAFSAHVYDRDEDVEITRQQLEESELDLIWAQDNGHVTDEWANEYGWTLVNDNAEFEALEEGERSFGAFAGELWNTDTGADVPNLSTLTAKAIDMLDDDEDGFFLMVEGAHIDKHSHDNDYENMVKAAYEFDLAVKAALEFAAADGDTLVVITADHETGGMKFTDSGVTYTRTSHSNANVPVFAYGVGGEYFDGVTMENIDVAKYFAKLMGKDDFGMPYEFVNPGIEGEPIESQD